MGGTTSGSPSPDRLKGMTEPLAATFPVTMLQTCMSISPAHAPSLCCARTCPSLPRRARQPVRTVALDVGIRIQESVYECLLEDAATRA